jgi:hypothetical protein
MTPRQQRMVWPVATAAIALATVLSIDADAAPAVRVPLVAATMLALPGVGLWRGLRLTGPAVALAGLVVTASIALDVVAAESLLLADQLHAVALVGVLACAGIIGTLRDLMPADAEARA